MVSLTRVNVIVLVMDVFVSFKCDIIDLEYKEILYIMTYGEEVRLYHRLTI